MIRRITYASCYVYSPAGESAASQRSRLLRDMLKAGDPRFIGKYAVRVRQQVAEDSPLTGFLGPGQVLVPIPGSTPPAAGALAVADRLALALLEAGLGRTIWRGLRRTCAVRKSSTAAPGRRPTVHTHFASFAVEGGAPPSRVVLIDDIVTKGRTLLAAAARLQDEYPTLDIRAFALLRTMGLGQGVNRLLDPCVGEIRWRAGDAHRTP